MDPLTQLKDIHLPETVHNYPIAYGWWILLAVVIVIAVISIRTFIRHKRKTHAKRVAIKSLSQPATSNDEIITLLKWAAIQYFPRQAIAQFHGKQLCEFLLKHLPEKHHEQFNVLSQQGLSNRYQATENKVDANLQQAALLWITHALPAKNKQHESEAYL